MIYSINYKLIITTSRKPSQITRRFAQFLKHYFNCEYINRGKMSFNKLINKAKDGENSLLLIINQTKGNPSSIDVYDVAKSDEAVIQIFATASLATQKEHINVNSDDLVFINKTNDFNDLLELFDKVNTHDKVLDNCIVIEEDDKNNNLACVSFIGRNAQDTRYKMYITGYKINL